MTYITENIIAMGFPAADLSSGFFGYVERFYRNHMEEVIRFLQTHHQGKYKVYNLCSERLYNASLFEGKVASFPFDDRNCPPIQLIILFCQSAYSWLKEDIENVVVVHCKAGMARTGLMISSLLLYLKFFSTVEESIDYYNQKRCIDGKALVLPSQIRYVKYFERILTYFNGENQPGQRHSVLYKEAS
ncbi:Phosphatidylinositol 3,4,5-trisphosphate 3-phosphatase and protein-tyrosine-phosphatase pten2a [Ancistrocladus abbreviatus]